MAKYMDQSGAQHFAEALMSATKTVGGQTIWGTGNIETGSGFFEGTYSEISSLVSSSSLIPGMTYIMNDYSAPSVTSVATAITSGTRVKIIVLVANSVNTFQPEAWAFTGSSTAMTFHSRVLYDINNDTSKYNWASSSGKGVIYRMVDKLNNEVPYDFTNLRPATCNVMSSSELLNTSINLEGCANCKISSFIDINTGKFLLPQIYIIQSKNINIGTNCNHAFILYSMNVNIGTNSSYIVIGDASLSEASDQSAYISIGNNCQYIDIANSEFISIGNFRRYVCLRCYGITSNSTTKYLRNSNVSIGNGVINTPLSSYTDVTPIGVIDSVWASYPSTRKTSYLHMVNCTIGDNAGIIYPMGGTDTSHGSDMCYLYSCSITNNTFVNWFMGTSHTTDDYLCQAMYTCFDYPLPSSKASWSILASNINNTTYTTAITSDKCVTLSCNQTTGNTVMNIKGVYTWTNI